MTGDARLPALEVFLAMLQRDARVVRHELLFFLVRTLMQPLLFIATFGYLLPHMLLLPTGYTTTLLPGVLAISLALSAVQSVSLPMVAAFGYTNEIEDRLLAPIPTRLVAVELVFVGAVQGMIAAAVVLPLGRLIMGPIPGLELLEIPDAAICCGSAGIYNLVEPETARQLADRKVQNILSTDAELVVTGNPGCLIQLRGGLQRAGRDLPVIHMIELLDASIQGVSPNGRREAKG